MNSLVTRRSLLVTGASAGAILSLGFGFKWMGRPANNSKLLSQIEIDVVEKAAGVLFPPGIFSIAGGDGFTAPEVDRLLADVVDPNVVTPFRAMLGALEWGTMVSRGQPFSSLTNAEAKDVRLRAPRPRLRSRLRLRLNGIGLRPDQRLFITYPKH